MAPSAALSAEMPSFRFQPGQSIADAPSGHWENPQRWALQGTMIYSQPGQDACSGEGQCSYLQPGDQVQLTENLRDVNGQRWVQVKIKDGGFTDGKLSDSTMWAKLDSLTSDSGQIQWDKRDKLSSGDADGSRTAFVQAAKQLEGTPYAWGGESKSGVDCSGLVLLSKKMAGIAAALPRQSAEQAAYTGAGLQRDQVKMGDLAFFGEPVHHVAICADDGCKTIIEAPNSGSVVQEHPLTREAKFGDFIDKGGAGASANGR